MIRGARGAARGATATTAVSLSRGRSRRRTREVGDAIEQPAEGSLSAETSQANGNVQAAEQAAQGTPGKGEDDPPSLIRWNSAGGTSKEVQIKSTYLPQTADPTEQRIMQLIKDHGNNTKQSQLPILWKKKFGGVIPVPKGKTLLEVLAGFKTIAKRKDPKTHDTLLSIQTPEGMREEILNGLSNKDMESWSTEDVCAWMEHVLSPFKLSAGTIKNYTGAVRVHCLRGEHLPMLQSHDLETCIGMAPLGHRLSLLKARDQLLSSKSMEEVYEGVKAAAQHSAAAAVATVDAVRLVETLAASVSELHAVVRGLSNRLEGKAPQSGGAKVVVKPAASAAAPAPKTAGGKEEGGGGAAKGPPSPTHFVSLPITSPALIASLGQVQAAMAAESPWYAPGLIGSKKLHVSMAILHCPDQATVERAGEALAACQSRLQAALDKGAGAEHRLAVKGLGTFKQGVLWAGMEGAALLQEMADVVTEAMQQAGALQGGRKEELKAHVTLMKTTFFSPSERKLAGKHSLSAPTAWMRNWGSAAFGSQVVDGLALCAMKSAKDGGYVVEKWVPLPAAAPLAVAGNAKWAALPSVVTWVSQAGSRGAGSSAGGSGVKVAVKLQFTESGRVEVLIDVHPS